MPHDHIRLMAGANSVMHSGDTPTRKRDLASVTGQKARYPTFNVFGATSDHTWPIQFP